MKFSVKTQVAVAGSLAVAGSIFLSIVAYFAAVPENHLMIFIISVLVIVVVASSCAYCYRSIDTKKETLNEQIRQALHATSSSIMLADAGRNIVYMNKAVDAMLREAESDLRKALPHFSVDRVVGSNMDIFHKNPAHQSHLLANLRETYVGNIVVAGRSFRLIANPIFWRIRRTYWFGG